MKLTLSHGLYVYGFCANFISWIHFKTNTLFIYIYFDYEFDYYEIIRFTSLWSTNLWTSVFFIIFAANTSIIMAEKYYKLTYEQLNEIVSDAMANAIKKNDWSTIKILSSFIQTQKKWRFYRWNRHFLMILNVWITSRKQLQDG